MKKMLLVFALVAVCSLAASATQTVTLTNFCDTWDLHVDRGHNPFGASAPKIFVWGTHDTPGTCTGTLDTIGMKHGANAFVPPNDIFLTSHAVYDISDVEGGANSIEFTIRCGGTSGSGAAAFIGGTSLGGHFFLAEDTATCSGKPAPTRTGLKPMVPRQ
jgi:hypothetical protein